MTTSQQLTDTEYTERLARLEKRLDAANAHVLTVRRYVRDAKLHLDSYSLSLGQAEASLEDVRDEYREFKGKHYRVVPLSPIVDSCVAGTCNHEQSEDGNCIDERFTEREP